MMYFCNVKLFFQNKPTLSTMSYAPKRDIQFPADSVEATQPLLKKRRRVTHRELGTLQPLLIRHPLYAAFFNRHPHYSALFSSKPFNHDVCFFQGVWTCGAFS